MRRGGPSKVRKVTQRAIGRNRECWVDHESALARFLSSYESALGSEREDIGRAFYPRWHELACRIARAHGQPIVVGAYALSALSPRLTAEWNYSAGEAIEAGDWEAPVLRTPLPESVDKARAIVETGDCSRIGFGSKTRSFARNIESPERAGAITLDVHTVSIAYGRALADSGMKLALERVGGYSWHSAPVRAAARLTGEASATFQSIVWHEWRHETGADWRERLADETF